MTATPPPAIAHPPPPTPPPPGGCPTDGAPPHGAPPPPGGRWSPNRRAPLAPAAPRRWPTLHGKPPAFTLNTKLCRTPVCPCAGGGGPRRGDEGAGRRPGYR